MVTSGMNNWEEVKQEQAGYLWRMKVPGGWLVKSVEDVMTTITNVDYVYSESNVEWRSSICFVPDANNEWKI